MFNQGLNQMGASSKIHSVAQLRAEFLKYLQQYYRQQSAGGSISDEAAKAILETFTIANAPQKFGDEASQEAMFNELVSQMNSMSQSPIPGMSGMNMRDMGMGDMGMGGSVPHGETGEVDDAQAMIENLIKGISGGDMV